MAVLQYTYTQKIHRMTQNKQHTEQHKNFGKVRAVPRLCGLYPGICLTTEEKARKNLIQAIFFKRHSEIIVLFNQIHIHATYNFYITYNFTA